MLGLVELPSPGEMGFMNAYITGTSSGLGKHLMGVFGGSDFDADITIHCAWPARPPEFACDIGDYYRATIDLTRRVLRRSHRLFIFISTCGVYPDSHSGREGEPIGLNHNRDLYTHCKLIAESVVREQSRNWLILRPVGMLGPTSRPNSITRILQLHPGGLTLAAASRLYYLTHEDVSGFIRHAIEKDLRGIWNVTSSAPVTLREVSERFNLHVSWGGHIYNTCAVNNQKCVAEYPALNKTSMQAIEEFYAATYPRAGAQRRAP